MYSGKSVTLEIKIDVLCKIVSQDNKSRKCFKNLS